MPVKKWQRKCAFLAPSYLGVWLVAENWQLTIGCVTLPWERFATPWLLDRALRLSSDTFTSHSHRNLTFQSSSFEIIVSFPEIRLGKGEPDHFLFMIYSKICNSQTMIVVIPVLRLDRMPSRQNWDSDIISLEIVALRSSPFSSTIMITIKQRWFVIYANICEAVPIE